MARARWCIWTGRIIARALLPPLKPALHTPPAQAGSAEGEGEQRSGRGRRRRRKRHPEGGAEGHRPHFAERRSGMRLTRRRMRSSPTKASPRRREVRKREVLKAAAKAQGQRKGPRRRGRRGGRRGRPGQRPDRAPGEAGAQGELREAHGEPGDTRALAASRRQAKLPRRSARGALQRRGARGQAAQRGDFPARAPRALAARPEPSFSTATTAREEPPPTASGKHPKRRPSNPQSPRVGAGGGDDIKEEAPIGRFLLISIAYLHRRRHCPGALAAATSRDVEGLHVVSCHVVAAFKRQSGDVWQGHGWRGLPASLGRHERAR